MFVTIALAVGGVIAVVLIVVLMLAASKPDVFRIQRAATVKAAPGKVFPSINDFHNWAAWSPYEKLDPTMRKSYTGSANGKGAVYEWEGNSKAGKGRMEITDTSTPSRVVIKLDFLKPFEGHNISEFALDGKGNSTQVTWAMHGPNSYMAKMMSIFMSMDQLLGKEFENGLANLKAAAEK